MIVTVEKKLSIFVHAADMGDRSHSLSSYNNNDFLHSGSDPSGLYYTSLLLLSSQSSIVSFSGNKKLSSITWNNSL
jgi:hypothetical protein